MKYPRGTTFSDRELARARELSLLGSEAFWSRNGVGMGLSLKALAGETLDARRILRDLIARTKPWDVSDELVARAVALLGFNLEPSQQIFPKWPEQAPGVERPKEK